MSSVYTKCELKGRTIYKYPAEYMHTLKELAYKIKKHYKIKPKSRERIIDNLIISLSNNLLINNRYPCLNKQSVWIIRGDIKSFFPSINKSILKNIFELTSFLGNDEIRYLYETLEDNDIEGLPQGNPLSSVLSELYLNDFDDMIIREFNPLFYNRFVDDFIIIIPKVNVNKINADNLKADLKKKIESLLKDIDLCLEKEKFKIIELGVSVQNTRAFSFLGYKFEQKKFLQGSKLFYLEIGIDNKKIKKYKAIMLKYLMKYNNSVKSDIEFNKFILKLQHILYGVITIPIKGSNLKGTKKSQKYGIPYTYRRINDFESLQSIENLLNSFIRNVEFNDYQKRELMKICTKFKAITCENDKVLSLAGTMVVNKDNVSTQVTKSKSFQAYTINYVNMSNQKLLNEFSKIKTSYNPYSDNLLNDFFSVLYSRR